jgi:hypothetical protein
MEEQIKKLVSLANEIVKYCEKNRYPSNHMDMTSSIHVYFAEGSFYETWRINFEKVGVCGYQGTVEMPIKSTAATLSKTLDKCRIEFEALKNSDKSALRKKLAEEKAERILTLEKELNDLKKAQIESI